MTPWLRLPVAATVRASLPWNSCWDQTNLRYQNSWYCARRSESPASLREFTSRVIVTRINLLSLYWWGSLYSLGWLLTLSWLRPFLPYHLPSPTQQIQDYDLHYNKVVIAGQLQEMESEKNDWDISDSYIKPFLLEPPWVLLIRLTVNTEMSQWLQSPNAIFFFVQFCISDFLLQLILSK